MILCADSGVYYNAHFEYDERNQLVGFEAKDGTTLIKSSHYIYDCFNRRVASVIDQAESGSSVATTYFVYAGQAAWQLAEEYPSEESDTVGNSYVYGLYIDEILTMRDHASANDDDYFYHQDDLFSVYAMTDEDGDVVERYEYGDYGQVSISDEDGDDRSVSSYGNRHTYTGRLLDTELTLDDGGQVLQYRHRYMSTGSGRFLQRDPLGYIDGQNLLAYVLSSPYTNVDPLGQQCSIPRNHGSCSNPGSMPSNPPCCNTPNWCHQVYRSRASDALRTFSICMSSALIPVGWQTFLLTLGCSFLTGGQLRACLVGSGIVVNALNYWRFKACFIDLDRAIESAQGSYCHCLSWKSRNCRAVNTEPNVHNWCTRMGYPNLP